MDVQWFSKISPSFFRKGNPRLTLRAFWAFFELQNVRA